MLEGEQVARLGAVGKWRAMGINRLIVHFGDAAAMFACLLWTVGHGTCSTDINLFGKRTRIRFQFAAEALHRDFMHLGTTSFLCRSARNCLFDIGLAAGARRSSRDSGLRSGACSLQVKSTP